MVGGWKAQGKAQCGYLKDCVKRTIVATRLVVIDDEEDENSTPIEPFLCGSEKFHGIKLKEPCWPYDSNYAGFQEIMDAFLLNQLTITEKRSYLKDKIWSLCFKDYVSSDVSMTEQVKVKCEENAGWIVRTRRFDIERSANMKVGRSDICGRLNADTESLTLFVTKFQNLIFDNLMRIRSNGLFTPTKNWDIVVVNNEETEGMKIP